jgi:hypothetical protein
VVGGSTVHILLEEFDHCLVILLEFFLKEGLQKRSARHIRLHDNVDVNRLGNINPGLVFENCVLDLRKG